MNDTELVSALESGGDLDRDLDRFLELKSIRFDFLSQRFAFDEFHGDVRLAIVLTHFINS
jgi:hypothetical protein